MQAVQIKSYSKEIHTTLNDIPKPQISDSEVLIHIKAAAVNPVELLILTGSVKRPSVCSWSAGCTGRSTAFRFCKTDSEEAL